MVNRRSPRSVRRARRAVMRIPPSRITRTGSRSPAACRCRRLLISVTKSIASMRRAKIDSDFSRASRPISAQTEHWTSVLMRPPRSNSWWPLPTHCCESFTIRPIDSWSRSRILPSESWVILEDASRGPGPEWWSTGASFSRERRARAWPSKSTGIPRARISTTRSLGRRSMPDASLRSTAMPTPRVNSPTWKRRWRTHGSREFPATVSSTAGRSNACVDGSPSRPANGDATRPPDQRDSRLGAVDGRERCCEFGIIASHGSEEYALERSSDQAWGSVSHGQPIHRDDRRHFFARPAEQDLVAHVELRAIDRALERRPPVFARVELEQGPAGDRFEHAVGHRRDDEVTVAHDHQGGAGAFRDLPSLRQQDRVVESVLARLDGREPVVLVVRACLDARGHHVVRDAAPRRHAHPHSPLALVVVRSRASQDERAGVDLTGPIRLHATGAVFAEVHHQPEVNVVVKVIGAQPFDDGRAQVVGRIRQLHAHHLHAVAEPFQVLVELPDVEVPLGGIPVRAQALVDVRAAQDGQREHAEVRVLRLHDLAVQPDLEVRVAGHYRPPMTGVCSTRRCESSWSSLRAWLHTIMPECGTTQLDQFSDCNKGAPMYDAHRAARFSSLRAALALALGLVVSAPAAAQQPTPDQVSAIRAACRADYQANCAGVPPGGAEALECLKTHAANTSAACQQALGAVGGGAPAAPAPPASVAPASSAPEQTVTAPAAATGAMDAWPHTYRTSRGTATIYQPQVIAWPEHRTLETRIAVAILPNGATVPVAGTINVEFTTQVDFFDRVVILTAPRLLSSSFPSVGTARAAQFEERIKAELALVGPTRVALALVVPRPLHRAEQPPDVSLDNNPPRIFVSTRPASLIVFDGEPLLAPIAGTSLSFAVNTNWDVFFDAPTRSWYLLNNGAWLMAPVATGPWVPAGKLPASFSALPADASFAAVKKQIPGRSITPKDVPTIFESTTPAAIIVTTGPPRYVAIPGTSRSYVANSDAAVFRDSSSGMIYFLVSGRWFRAPGVDGPWTFATASLPPDFARIPADSPRGFVLASVPGTTQAKEALTEAQIPKQATLNRATTTVTVVYSGAPQFVAIPGTTLSYAVNTSFNVIQTGAGYYSCYQGAWFVASAATGPWALAPSVPAVIYTIPPTSPMYPCTYVKVYTAMPTTVTYGYTAGYTMSYVSAGVVVYGTGYYYPPYVYPAPVPIYYPYPYSYSGATYYNSATGAWAQGGAIYGPYGGVAKGGTAYNPTTGAWATGGAIYGPNGGAGAFSAYNPTTGSYAHGSAVWGPGGASGNASWYNARTGISGSTQQNSNEYGRWGSSTISGPNQTVHTQSQSDARGSAGSFSSSTGAKGAGVSGAGGNSAGVVKGAGGDVYAGADGNVYKKTDNGWEKYNNGGWAPVQQPTAGQRGTQSTTATPSSAAASQGTRGESRATQTSAASSASERNPSGAMERPAGQSGTSRFEGFNQLENDRAARLGGAQRFQQSGAMGGGFGGFRGAGRAGGFRR